MGEMAKVLSDAENNENINVVIVTGSNKAFAAGADIKEMQNLD